MADNIKYEIQSEDELLEKIKEEIEVLESIYDGENVILKAPEIIKNDQKAEQFNEFQRGDENK